jgi:hypothetical protein
VKDEKESSLNEIAKLEKRMEQLRNEKARKIEMLSLVRIEYGTEVQRYDEYVKRSKIGQFLLGDKRVEREKKVNYTDRRAYDDAQIEISNIKREMDTAVSDNEDRIKTIKQSLDAARFRQIDREIKHAEVEEQASLDEFFNQKEEQRNEKQAMEHNIITSEIKKYTHELNEALDNMRIRICSFLDSSQKNFVSILLVCFDKEMKSIEIEKENIKKIVSINEMSPEELDAAILEMNKENEAITKCLKEIEKEKEGF